MITTLTIIAPEKVTLSAYQHTGDITGKEFTTLTFECTDGQRKTEIKIVSYGDELIQNLIEQLHELKNARAFNKEQS